MGRFDDSFSIQFPVFKNCSLNLNGVKRLLDDEIYALSAIQMEFSW